MRWQYVCATCGGVITLGDVSWSDKHGPGKCGPSRRSNGCAVIDPVLAMLAAENYETDAVIHARRADRMRELAEESP